MADWLQEMTGCTREQAEEAMRKYSDEIYLALESLLPKTSVPGDKYIPEKPKIDTGLSLEQKELCQKGRDLQDKVNAVFSVAHSKAQSPPDRPDASEQSSKHCAEKTSVLTDSSSSSELGLDVHARTTQ